MRKVDSANQSGAPSVLQSRDRASRELVCLALILAVAVVLFRIAITL
jgi:hypothetical protein